MKDQSNQNRGSVSGPTSSGFVVLTLIRHLRSTLRRQCYRDKKALSFMQWLRAGHDVVVQHRCEAERHPTRASLWESIRSLSCINNRRRNHTSSIKHPYT
ncbi:hypothetical protein F4W70_00660 [Pseudomonas cannabina]|nr:hypothetical protein F4W70_00660 [Pseudomonas cannabina]